MKKIIWSSLIILGVLGMYFIVIGEYSIHNGRLYSHSEWKRECLRKVDKHHEDSLASLSLPEKNHIGHKHLSNDTVNPQ